MKVKLPVERPGIYSGIPIDDYHSARIAPGPFVTSTGLRTLWKKSPAHFFAGWPGNPDRVERDESEALTLGRAAHHLLLGEDDFSTRFICRPAELPEPSGELKPWQSNRKVCRAWIAEQRAADRAVLTTEQLDTIRNMARSLSRHPLIQAGILNGEIERSMIARDPETGIWIGARPDAIPTDGGDYSDLKTTTSVIDFDLKGTLRDYGYHQQAALVWEVCELLGRPFESWTLIFTEKTPPFCTRAVQLTDDDLARGRRQNRAMLRLMAKCLEAGEWPGPGNADAEFMSLPASEQEWTDKRLDMIEAASGDAA